MKSKQGPRKGSILKPSDKFAFFWDVDDTEDNNSREKKPATGFARGSDSDVHAIVLPSSKIEVILIS